MTDFLLDLWGRSAAFRLVAAAAVALLIAIAVHRAIRALLWRLSADHPMARDMLRFARAPMGWLVPLAALAVVLRARAEPTLLAPISLLSHALVVALIGVVSWLGVRCVHCHVGEEGKPLSTFDFASDAKKEKLVARKMLNMVHRINSEDFGIKDFKDVKVTCYTCHRGATKPLTAVPEPPAAPTPLAPATPAPQPQSTQERGSA